MSNFLPPVVEKLVLDISDFAQGWAQAQAIQRAGAAALASDLPRAIEASQEASVRRAGIVGSQIGAALAGPIRRATDLHTMFREHIRRLETTHAGLFSRLIGPLSRMGDRLGDALQRGFVPHVESMARFLGRVFSTDGRAGFIIRGMQGFGRMIGSLFPGGQRGMAVGITSLIYGLAQLIAAVGPSIGILNLFPALVYAGAAALTTLILGFKGVGAALSAGLAGDLEKFNEAMGKLAPAAQVAVRQLLGLRDLGRSLKLTVQENLFAPWAASIKQLGTIYLPLLRETLGGVALDLGNVIRRIIDWHTSARGLNQMRTLFADMRYALHNMFSILPGLIEGFTNLSRAGMVSLTNLTMGWDKLGQRFADWTAKLADTGRLNEIIMAGADALQVMWDILKPIGSLLSLLVKALNEAGGAGGGILMSLINSLVSFMKTAEGFAAVVSIFELANEVFMMVGHVIGELLKLALPLFNALRPGLDLLIEALTIVVDALSAGLLPAVTAVAKALEPFLVLLGEQLVVLAEALAPILTELGTLLGEVLVTAIEALLPAAMQLLPVLVEALVELLPVIIPLLRILADLIIIQAPLISLLARLLAVLLVPAVKLLLILLSPFIWALSYIADGLSRLLPLFTKVGDSIVTTAFAAETWRKVGDWFVEVWHKVENFVRDVPNKLRAMASDAFTWLRQAGRDVIEGLKQGFLDRWGSAVDLVRSFGRALVIGFNAAVGIHSPSRVFEDAGRNIGLGLIQGINTIRKQAIDAAMNLVVIDAMMKRVAASPLGTFVGINYRGLPALPAPVIPAIGRRGGGAYGGGGGGGGGYGGGGESWQAQVVRLLTEIRDRVEAGLTINGRRLSDALIPYAQQTANRNGTSGLS